MKILYLSDSYIPSKAANSVHIIKMCEAFAENNHQVVMTGMSDKVKFDKAEIRNQYGVKSNFDIRLNFVPQFKGALFVNAAWNVINVLRYKPNLVVGRSYVSAAVLSLFFSCDMIFETHTPYFALDSLRKWAFKKIIRKAKMIVVISDALRVMLANEMKANGLKIGAIKVHHDAATEPSNHIDRDATIFSKDRFKIGYVGTINAGRGIEQMLQLSLEMPSIEFHVIGGNLCDLRQKLNINSVPPNLICHGYVPPKFSAYYRSNMDVLVAPYQENTSINSGVNTSSYMSPLKIFEYMSAGKAIIASDLPVIREVLNDSNALLVHANDISAWKAAIMKLQDFEFRSKLGRKALEDFRWKYTWKRRAQEIIAGYQDIQKIA
jgi:glycosyltransferase involved in cell wall biosynthesis